MLRDKLIQGLLDKALQERLIRETSKKARALQEVVSECKTAENTIDEWIVVTPFTDFFVLHNLIRFGDVVKVSEFIWKHPNSLLKPEGIPSVMVDNIDYNALQAAASLNFPLICQLILDICGKPEFYRLIFPDHSTAFISRVRDIFYKQYLNSGSQSTGDTPLHFAAKFGFIDCCKIFLSNPQCDTTHINHGVFTPEEIICACVNEQNNVMKEDIQALFTDGMLYVPVFRSENKLSSFVGSPITCKNLHSIQFDAEYNNIATYSLAAYAGPMCLKMAQMFHKGLKNPSSLKHFKLTRLQRSILSGVNFSDPEKGIERIGRHHVGYPLATNFLILQNGVDKIVNSTDGNLELFCDITDVLTSISLDCIVNVRNQLLC
ncbi:ankyrin repeat and LEM domain-containing protein 2 [Trichonephila inaurata madagascariensis]|uniref:Ankyrin repeat and LEM domain-containing protein 2 n=1 Tax=Trichonephila inaurata madagascariensis TaxID=2747483 RepID=A0A8X6JA81_9ARAC|nr:ankyrin repeat and LEM domain-containing protein 2 [Trichonephila inaurata madagascariensis]